MMARTIVWFRGKDLRLDDHLPLAHAIARGGEIVPLMVLEDAYFGTNGKRPPHRMQFFIEAVRALDSELRLRGSSLFVARGKGSALIPSLVQTLGADLVVSQETVEPGGRARDDTVARALGVRFLRFNGETIHPPGTIRNLQGRAYGVFTPFSKAWRRDVSHASCVDAPTALPPVLPEVMAQSLGLPEDQEAGAPGRNPSVLQAGPSVAVARLARFVRDGATAYKERRDRLDLDGTSRLSADLRFGTISPRRVWRTVQEQVPPGSGQTSFENELIWREFAYSTLRDFPSITHDDFQRDFAGFPWRDDDEAFVAWAEGRTGYPVVDAAARQLRSEGYVHNRARMIAASFLTKDLLIDWRRGEAWYRHWLTDGDLAQNVAGWQWTAGSGCDPQPYFRIFNPVTQAERFDPDGEYIRRWVPELAHVPAPHIHAPWTADPASLRRWNVVLGNTYPRPIVDHAFARDRFLAVASSYLKRAPGSVNAPLPLGV